MTDTAVQRDAVVRMLPWLLAATAVTTVAVEVINYRYTPEEGFGLAVRTGWALLRTLGWLILIWHVRRGRAGAKPLGLILAVTTVFAVGRLVVPQTGAPPLPGVIGFGVLVVLCVTVVALLYRHPAVTAHLVRYPNRLTLGRDGLAWREATPGRPQTPGWLLTARISAFTYSPLMLVPCLIAAAELPDKPEFLLAVIVWFVAGAGVTNAILPLTFLLMRGKPFARRALHAVGATVLIIDLPLCLLMLGWDGLIRDGVPLVAAVTLTSYSLWRVCK